MTARVILPLTLAVAAAVACGCVDPSIYNPPPGARVGGIVTPGSPSAYPTPTLPTAPTLPTPTVRAPTLPTPRIPAPATPTPRAREFPVPAPTPALPAPSSGNVAITIEKVGASAQTADEASLAFRYADENVVVQSPGTKLARRNGIRVGVARGNLRTQLDAATRRVQHTTRDAMFIVVTSGQEGQILMGSDVYVQSLVYLTPYGQRVLAERGFVGRSLVVRPRILGDGMVEVELWPRLIVRGQRGALDVTDLATKVVVRDGQSLVIGGIAGASEDVGAVLFGVGGRTRSHTMTMVLTPRIGGVGIDRPGSRR